MTKQEFSLFWKVWFSPKEAIVKINKIAWSKKKIFLLIFIQAVIIESLHFAIFLMNPDWLHPNTIVLGKQIILTRGFVRETVGILANSVRDIVIFYIFIVILSGLGKIFSKENRSLYKKFLLGGAFWYSGFVFWQMSKVLFSLVEKLGIDVSRVSVFISILFIAAIIWMLYVLVQMFRKIFEDKFPLWKIIIMLLFDAILTVVISFILFIILQVVFLKIF